MSVLRQINVSSGVNPEGKPFCQVQVEHSDDEHGPLLADAMGQLDPRTVRTMALGFLSAAEAAIHDASVFRLLTEDFEIEPRLAARLVRDLRERRIDADEMSPE